MTSSLNNNASAVAVRDSLQLLLREDPSLQSLLNAKCSIQEFATTTVASDLEAKLALVESLAVKVSRTSPEAISQQFLTTDMKKFQTQSQRLLSSSRSIVATAQRVESVLQHQATRLSTAVTKLQHAIALQTAVKQLLKLHFESQKEFDLDDRRDLLKAAGKCVAFCKTPLILSAYFGSNGARKAKSHLLSASSNPCLMSCSIHIFHSFRRDDETGHSESFRTPC
jgi:hypothetical protein